MPLIAVVTVACDPDMRYVEEMHGMRPACLLGHPTMGIDWASVSPWGRVGLEIQKAHAFFLIRRGEPVIALSVRRPYIARPTSEASLGILGNGLRHLQQWGRPLILCLTFTASRVGRGDSPLLPNTPSHLRTRCCGSSEAADWIIQLRYQACRVRTADLRSCSRRAAKP